MNKATIERLLPAIAYGDAAGLPFESHKESPQAESSVTELQDTTRNPYIGPYPAGTWSDDTHLSIAVARSLETANGFDLESQAVWHNLAYRHVLGSVAIQELIPPIVTTDKQNGWGRGTTMSVKRLIDGVPPTESGEETAAGNGVLMKLAPLVFWQLARQTPQTEAEEQLTALTRMTHRASEALVASLVHYQYLKHLFVGGVSPQDLLQVSYEQAQHYEAAVGTEPVLSRRLEQLVLADTLDREVVLKAAPKKGFFAPETLVMAYGSFALQATAPESVFRAVELGGDADSVGSIVATLSLATNPVDVLKDRSDYSNIHAIDRIEKVSRNLAQAAYRQPVDRTIQSYAKAHRGTAY